jgi:hypothetical protein
MWCNGAVVDYFKNSFMCASGTVRSAGISVYPSFMQDKHLLFGMHNFLIARKSYSLLSMKESNKKAE